MTQPLVINQPVRAHPIIAQVSNHDKGTLQIE
jgi:hypothetical protein